MGGWSHGACEWVGDTGEVWNGQAGWRGRWLGGGGGGGGGEVVGKRSGLAVAGRADRRPRCQRQRISSVPPVFCSRRDSPLDPAGQFVMRWVMCSGLGDPREACGGMC